MKTALYRHFNVDGQLLYVGIECPERLFSFDADPENPPHE